VAARVTGLRRCYAALLRTDGTLQLVKALDGDTILAEAPFAWEPGRIYNVELTVRGANVSVTVDGQRLLRATDGDRPLMNGGIALVVEDGFLSTPAVRVRG